MSQVVNELSLEDQDGAFEGYAVERHNDCVQHHVSQPKLPMLLSERPLN